MSRVLIAEDDAVARDLLHEILASIGHEVQAVDCGEAAIERVADRYDLVISDMKMQGASGLDVLAAFGKRAPEVPVILITAFGDVTSAMEAIDQGACDYISKPFDVAALKRSVGRALERRRLSTDTPATTATPTPLGLIQGRSRAMLEVYKLVARVAPSIVPVLVRGESGTGKELVARTIHARSDRSGGPFVPVNCTAVPESLLESELFGHARGSFTGALTARKGLFELADGGTLFLDEVGDMGARMQAQLLRVLQDGEVRAVGANETTRVDIRLVCATHRNLEDDVRAGRFREDLFFRINVVQIEIPPLRERQEDILPLVEHFLRQWSQRDARKPARLARPAVELLEGFHWPGNVRQLENVIARAYAVAGGDVILAEDLPVELRPEGAPARASGALIDDRPPLAELERRYAELMVRECEGNKKKAAERLGIDRRTLYRLLARGNDDDGAEGGES